MLPEPDLIDSVLLFSLIKVDCSCSRLLAVSSPSAPTREGAVINFMMAADPLMLEFPIVTMMELDLSSHTAQPCPVLPLEGGCAQ